MRVLFFTTHRSRRHNRFIKISGLLRFGQNFLTKEARQIENASPVCSFFIINLKGPLEIDIYLESPWSKDSKTVSITSSHPDLRLLRPSENKLQNWILSSFSPIRLCNRRYLTFRQRELSVQISHPSQKNNSYYR